MDFFERQHQAKKKTGYLVFLFGVAVLLISLLNFLIIAAVIPFVGEERKREGLDFSTLQDPMLAMYVVLGTFVVIFLAGLYRKSQLSGGGSSIASMMGGRLVNMASTDPDEQKLMNVVEEMAIASSVPMPEVFVMNEEKGINAFAAGYTVDDAVIGVTDGCMRRLSRDELQGVIAHEFSHILNQDMRLNLRLVAVVFGLFVLSQLGRLMMQIGFSSSGRRSSRNRDEGGGAAVIGIAGLGIMAAGGLGILMGNLIKSAVSRQREYLADSSAVQFTRNPDGLAGALKKIGAMATGSRLLTPHAEEASHMFFGNGMSESWLSFTATHPPLLDRILLLEPSFDGGFSEVKFEERRSPTAKPDSKARRTQSGIPIPGMGDALGQALPPVILGLAAAGQVHVGSAAAVADSIGNPTQQHIDFAAALLASLPEAVRAAAHDTHDACALVFALLLDPKDGPVRKKQLGQVDELFGKQMAKATLKLSGAVASLDHRAKLPVADLAVGSLRQLSPEQFDSFTHLLETLAAADGQIDLFEFSLSKLVIRHLEPNFLKQRKKTAQVYSLKRLGHECSVLISSLAYTAGSNDETIQAAYDAGAVHLAATIRLTQLPAAECGLQELDKALGKLAGVAINLKRQLIEAAAATVSADGYLQIQEAELLRAVSDSLGCPMPPLAIALATAA
ncbi:MAG: M48 family metallopeptidase [Verrucomicrobia bacterium]|nr:M48 family metallopeptidase [Verrucomicrobiota bacterium]MBT6659831.1 M48 family metallopeptidase [Verrucomicrobiota bacterium]MBT7735702.1 M48 family metallopeptidase [Verrucomicrobiota bacterium]